MRVGPTPRMSMFTPHPRAVTWAAQPSGNLFVSLEMGPFGQVRVWSASREPQ